LIGKLPRATLFSVGERLIAFVLQFGATVVIARLLSPAEVGVFSLAASLVAIGHVFRQFGVGDFLVQERALDRDLLRAAYGMTLAVSWAIAALLLVAAAPLAMLYREPAVAQVLQVMALSFLLMPIGSICSTMLVRELSFGRLAAVQTASTAVAAATSVALAWAGWSSLSLAWGAVAGNAVTLVLFALLRPAEFFMWPRLGELRRILRFGTPMTGSYLSEQLAARVPDLLMPRSLGFEALGLFSRGQSLALTAHDVLVTGFVRVARPVFAAGEREPAALRETYLAFLTRLAAPPLAAFLFMAIFAEPLVRVLFGATWLPSAPVLTVTAVSLALAVPWYLAPGLLIGTGRAGPMLRVALVRLLAAGLAVAVGVQIGLMATALLLALASLLHLTAYQRALRAATGIRLADLARACAPSLRVIGPALAVAALARLMPADTAWQALLSVGAGLGLLTGMSVSLAILTRHPLAMALGRLGGLRQPAASR